jgi:hypothetical protein
VIWNDYNDLNNKKGVFNREHGDYARNMRMGWDGMGGCPRLKTGRLSVGSWKGVTYP